MTQCLINEIDFLFLSSLCFHCVINPFPESERENVFKIILRYRKDKISIPNRLLLVAHMAMVLNL